MEYKTGETPQKGDIIQSESVVINDGMGDDSVLVTSGRYTHWVRIDKASLVKRAEPPCVRFEEALAAYREGKQIRSKRWPEGEFFKPGTSIELAEDWQIYEPEDA